MSVIVTLNRCVVCLCMLKLLARDWILSGREVALHDVTLRVTERCFGARAAIAYFAERLWPYCPYLHRRRCRRAGRAVRESPHLRSWRRCAKEPQRGDSMKRFAAAVIGCAMSSLLAPAAQAANVCGYVASSAFGLGCPIQAGGRACVTQSFATGPCNAPLVCVRGL